MRASPPTIRLLGTPIQLDLYLRPLVRAIQVTVGMIPTVVLLFYGQWWWAPVPLALSFVLYEAFFWSRGDRPIKFELGDTIVLDDPAADRRREIRPEQVHAVTVHHRARGGDRSEVVVVLASRTDILLSVRFLVEPDVRLPKSAVDVELMDELLGGYGGLVAPTASPTERCRQTIDDPTGQALRWFRANLPTAAWRRRAARVWRGAAPKLDAFGLHADAPAGLLVLQGDDWALHENGETLRGTITLVSSARTTRTVELARKPREGETLKPGEFLTEEVDVPVLVLELDEALSLAMPAPLAGLVGQHREPDDALLHCHVAEGGALLWNFLTRWRRSAWPAPLRKQADNVLSLQDDEPLRADARRGAPTRTPTGPDLG